MSDAAIEHEGLLEDWRCGRADRTDLYRAVRKAMYQAARQGVGSITSSTPDPEDVEDAVYAAFVQLTEKDPAQVTSLVGLAKRIAFRRGQDAGRAAIRRREQIRADSTDRALIADLEYRDEEVLAATEQEMLVVRAEECIETLTEDQRDLIRATLMGRETLSDWALRKGKSHQAASRQRLRAVESLQRCMQTKKHTDGTRKGGNDERQG